MKKLEIDTGYLLDTLGSLLEIASPTGMTDAAVAFVCDQLAELGVPHELTRRGAIRADLKGRHATPDRAIVTHVDTLGAIVKGYRANGRLELDVIGNWSARFAEGARATIFADHQKRFRGTILPSKASGHVFGDEVDEQPSSWPNLEFRIDERVTSPDDVTELGIHVGDLIAIDTQPEFCDSGFVNARHLDDKAGVASVLAAAKAIVDSGIDLPIDCHLLFTISEEVGIGASHILHGDVAEMLSVDNGTFAPGQYTSEFGVTVAMKDSSGPFDWHLTRNLIDICSEHGLEHTRDVFNHYRSDAAAALEAGNDIRTALVCFGLDASHGYERVHTDSLVCLSKLVTLYAQSEPLFERDRQALGPPGDLPSGEEQGGERS